MARTIKINKAARTREVAAIVQPPHHKIRTITTVKTVKVNKHHQAHHPDQVVKIHKIKANKMVRISHNKANQTRAVEVKARHRPLKHKAKENQAVDVVAKDSLLIQMIAPNSIDV